MRILFLHGWHSVPGGLKPTYLKDHGHEVINPKLDDDNFDAAVRTAQANYDQHDPDVIVGSSRGGAVAMNINSGETKLILLCPAWKNWGTVNRLKPNSVILHSRKDEVVPFADSEELISSSGLSPDTLFEVGCDHRLADPEPLDAMLSACEERASFSSSRAFDLQNTFQSGNNGRDNFLSRLFGMCSEEPVRFWGEMESSPYEYIGRPTIRPKSESGWTTLDFAFRRKSDGLQFVAEMKCELAYCGYRYMTLNANDQIERHRTEQLKQGKKSFARFLEAAITPDAFNCNVTKRSNRQLAIPFSGAILVWGRTTPEGRDAAINHFGFADVLSVESIVNDLLRAEYEPYRQFINERTTWCGEMFSALLGR